MATIRVHTTDSSEPKPVSASSAESLLTALLKGGEPIRHDCGGRALCGTCRVRILSGARGLSPVLPRERTRLGAVGAALGDRLACQAHALRDVEIEPVLPMKSTR